MCADWEKVGGGVWAFFAQRRRRGGDTKKAIFGGGVGRRDVIFIPVIFLGFVTVAIISAITAVKETVRYYHTAPKNFNS